jgi:hypothetical protein
MVKRKPYFTISQYSVFAETLFLALFLTTWSKNIVTSSQNHVVAKTVYDFLSSKTFYITSLHNQTSKKEQNKKT